MQVQELKGIKVLVCIFTHNAAETIEHVLEALFQQSFKDFVIFIIDNNSSDGTIAVADSYLKAVTFGSIPLPDLFNFKGETTKDALGEMIKRLLDILENYVKLPDLDSIRFVGQEEILEVNEVKNRVGFLKWV